MAERSAYELIADVVCHARMIKKLNQLILSSTATAAVSPARLSCSLFVHTFKSRYSSVQYDSLCSPNPNNYRWLGGSVGRALARDRKVASSTPGQSATE